MTKSVLVKFQNFDVTLNFKKRVKNLRLRVDKNAKISMSLPFYSTQKAAFAFLAKHVEWLVATHTRISANLPLENEFIFLGEKWSVKLDPDFKGVKFQNFSAPGGGDEIYAGEILAPNFTALENFKKARAKQIYGEMIAKFEPLIARPATRLCVRKMATRWGSCNSRKGYINLSLNLIEKPLAQVEYVVLHELAHLLYPHHGTKFYEFIAGIMPDFHSRERALNGKNS